MRLSARSTVIAGALAAAAIASPMATARVNLEPTGQTQSAATAPPVLPNPDEQVTHTSQVGPPALPPVTASQLGEVHRLQTAASHAFAYQPPARYSPAGLNGYVSSPTNGAPAVIHVTTHDNGFDWGAAAIGAAGGLVISVLILGGGILLMQRRQLNPSGARSLASQGQQQARA